VTVAPALLATPCAALGDSTSSALVAAQPIHGDDALEHHGDLILCPRALIRQLTEVVQIGGDSFQHAQHSRPVEPHEIRLDLGIGPSNAADGARLAMRCSA
jgi:hypothetical protein